MLKENNIDCKSEINTDIDTTEINETSSEEEDIFNELNDKEIIDKNEINTTKNKAKACPPVG